LIINALLDLYIMRCSVGFEVGIRHRKHGYISTRITTDRLSYRFYPL
jgi:hypothetical protein